MSESSPLRRVLVLAYYFPPLGLSGVQRTFKFVKYLPEHGWKPTVITVEPRSYFAHDESLLQELDGRDVEIIRTPSRDPFALLAARGIPIRLPSSRRHRLLGRASQAIFIPDNKIGWKRHALARAREVLDRGDIDLIYATAPPYTAFLIGEKLKQTYPHIPLVLDYRDAWLHNPLHFYPTPIHRLRHRALEQRCLRAANRIITINRRIKELLLTEYTMLGHGDIDIVPQGYDAADFPDLQPPKDGPLILTHTGTFYHNRTPRYLLQALASLRARSARIAKDIRLRFVGAEREEDRLLARQLGVEDQVEFLGYRPHAESVRLLLESHALFMMIGSGPGEDMMSTGKLYEYLGSRRPILAAVPDGVARQALLKSEAAFVVPPEDPIALAQELDRLLTLHRTHALPVGEADHARQYERGALTGQLTRIFESAIAVEPRVVKVHPRSSS